MNIKEMHYDFKMKINKVDSQQYRNLRIPEIDWLLNNAQELFVKWIAEPRKGNILQGFEVNQRSIDDIREIVVDDIVIASTGNLAVLPDDYWHFLRGYGKATNEQCQTPKWIRLHVKQHDDLFEESPFDKSSMFWEVINCTFHQNNIRTYASDFTIDELRIDYIKIQPYIHNAEDFVGNQYKDLKGNILIGTQDCVLSFHTHKEIVDIAVLIATGSIQIPDYQNKMAKINLNHL